MDMNSRLYQGWVRHRRYAPKTHHFRYPIFMLYLDLDEIDAVFRQSRWWSLERFNWASFRRRDFFAPEAGDLKQAVIGHLCRHSELNPDEIASVRLLTHVRYLGYIFNPVSVYYAFDRDDRLLAIMPEVTNTPWKDRFQYVLLADPNRGGEAPTRVHRRHLEFRPNKAFHVSPFLPMNMQYRWVFSEPADEVRVHLENHSDGHRQFDATLVMAAEPVTARTLNRALIRFPAMTVKVTTGIYWQALKLWWKGVPFYRHPNKDKKGRTA
ncbi:DUF1365 domain-containing protein [Saccharospirillum salsuginis]|uniref:DUF1365 domain-containing protein n=2 Tax=Saccharospirillum salsuginis TaxID=418750 RepID=A0A918KHG2_9GAMM|nr:DUF1365 domain-containing protein [Saccharospirillum salsuginis]